MGQLARKTRLACAALLACAGWLLVAAPAARPAADGWTWPVTGRVITPYSNDDAQPYAGGMHRGIDIAAPEGTGVVAARAGEVTYAAPLGYSGLTVAVRSADRRYVASYLHLGAVSVKRGQAVRAGERLGAVGTTGRRSAREPHLHFGVHLEGDERHYVDPLSLLPAPGSASEPGAPVPARVPVPVAALPAPIKLPAAAGPRAQRQLEPGRGRLLPHPRGARAPVALPGPALLRPAPSHTAPARERAADGRSGARGSEGHLPAAVPIGEPREKRVFEREHRPAIAGTNHSAARPSEHPRPGADTGRLLLWAGLAVLVLALAAPVLRHGVRKAPALRLSSLLARMQPHLGTLGWRRSPDATTRADDATTAEGAC